MSAGIIIAVALIPWIILHLFRQPEFEFDQTNSTEAALTALVAVLVLALSLMGMVR